MEVLPFWSPQQISEWAEECTFIRLNTMTANKLHNSYLVRRAKRKHVEQQLVEQFNVTVMCNVTIQSSFVLFQFITMLNHTFNYLYKNVFYSRNCIFPSFLKLLKLPWMWTRAPGRFQRRSKCSWKSWITLCTPLLSPVSSTSQTFTNVSHGRNESCYTVSLWRWKYNVKLSHKLRQRIFCTYPIAF